jgi:DNA primase catalytic core
MARIPDDELERLKQDVDLVRLVQSAGVELKRKGDSWIGLCPFHEDTSPSLVVTPRKNLWSCLGACQTGGTVIDWVMRLRGMGFREAVEILRGETGLTDVGAGAGKDAAQSCPVERDAAGAELSAQVIEYYHRTLLEEPAAQAYLRKRGIGDPEAVRTFKLGFANRSLGLRLPRKQQTAGARLRHRLTEIGFIRRSGHEHFNGSLVIPIHNARGEVVEVYGRKLHDKLRPGTAYHLYLPGPHRGVWNLDALLSSKEIILCEALIDALTFWCAGYRNVTSSYGTNGFTGEHLEALKAYGVSRVLIAYDNDEAGNQAAKKLADRLGAEGIGCSRILFPRQMGANEYALKVKPAS